MKKIVLASSSPRRREILKRLGLDFQIITSQVDEKFLSKDPRLVSESLAREKCLDVSKKVKGDNLIIAADTVVYKDIVLGKPVDLRKASRQKRCIFNVKTTKRNYSQSSDWNFYNRL